MNQIMLVATVFENLGISIPTATLRVLKCCLRMPHSGQLTFPMNSAEQANRPMKTLDMFI